MHAAAQGQPPQPPPIQNPGLFNYGSQVAMNAGPGQGAKFQELSGLYATSAVATGIAATGLTMQMGIPTFAESFRQGAAVRYGMNSGAYKAANFARGFDITRMGLGGFGSVDMLSANTMGKLATGGVGGAASPLAASLQAAQTASQMTTSSVSGMGYAGAGRGIVMHEMGLNASMGKRVHAFIAGGEAAFGRTLAAGAEAGEAITVANQGTLNAMRYRGIGGSLKAAQGAGRFSRAGFGLLRGLRAATGAVAGTGVGLLPAVGMMAATEGIIGTGMQMYQGAADASMGERVMEMMAPQSMSYGRQSARDFGMGLEQMSKSFGMDTSRLLGVMDSMSMSGDFNGAKDMSEFRKKLTSRLKELKKLSEETATTIEEAQQITSTLKQSGVMSFNTAAVGRNMMGYNRSTGIGLDRLMQAGSMGFQQAVQMGTDLDMGFASGQRSVAGMEMLMKSGGLTESQRRNIQLMGGADQAAMMLNSSTKRLAPMMAIAMERQGTDSEGFAKYGVNKEKMEKFVRGGYSRRELERMMMSPDMAGKTAAFMENTELYSQSVEQMQEAMVNFGINNASADYTAAEIIGKTFGMHKNHAELLINHQMAMQAADANVGIETAKAQKLAARQRFDSRQSGGVMRSMDIMYAASGFRGAGRRMSDAVSDMTSFIGGRENSYESSAQGMKLAMGATPDQFNRVQELAQGRDRIGFMSGSYGVFSAFNEAERERAYSAYGKRFGASVDSDFVKQGIEGQDFLLGDQNFMGDIGRMLMFNTTDKRAIDLNKLDAHMSQMDQLRGAGNRLGAQDREKLTNFMRMKRIGQGASAFENVTAFSGFMKMGDSALDENQLSSLAQEIKKETGLDFTTEAGRRKLGISKDVSMQDALGVYLGQSAPDAGFDPRSLELGFNQVMNAGLNLGDFSAERLGEVGRKRTGDKVLVESVDETVSYNTGDKDSLMSQTHHKTGRKIDAHRTITALNNYSNLGASEKAVLREGIQHVASGGALIDVVKRFEDAGLTQEFNALKAQQDLLTSNRNQDPIKAQLSDLEALETIAAYEGEFGERNKQLGKKFREIGGIGMGGMNFMVGGNLAKDLGNYDMKGAEGVKHRRNLTRQILEEITDGKHDDAAQRKRLIDGGISEVYSLHAAFDRLTGKDAATREQVMESLGISGHGSGKGGAFTREEAIAALSKIELANFKGSEEMVKAQTIKDNPMVSPREFTMSMDGFVKALDKFTKTVKDSKDPNNGDSKPDAKKEDTSWFSDKRLKKNIKFKRLSPQGIPVYTFQYKGKDTMYEGVMAQDLIESFPEALSTENGYYKVDYSQLDIEFKEV